MVREWEEDENEVFAVAVATLEDGTDVGNEKDTRGVTVVLEGEEPEEEPDAAEEPVAFLGQEGSLA